MYRNDAKKPASPRRLFLKGGNRMNDCETCAYYYYDEEWQDYVCERDLDEDEYARFLQGQYKQCPYYRDGDDYKIASKQ
jgi:hypothetical protein